MIGGFLCILKKAVGIVHELSLQPFIFVKLWIESDQKNSKRGYYIEYPHELFN